jgi:mono/diheme cytochrome c family protein
MHAPMSTFAYEGKQYVLAYSAGNALIGSPRGDSVWLFGLEGTLPPADAGVPVNRLAATIPAAPAAAAAPPVAAPAAAAADVANGRRVYEETCVICHGEDGLGGHGGGAPLDNVPNAAFVVDIVTGGRNNMPGLATLLTPVQISDVAAYVADHLATKRAAD